MGIAVTGGAGFIGCNLVRALVGAGHHVTVVDDFSTGYRANLAGCPVRLVEGSILDPAVLDAALGGCDTVVHLAARPSVPRSLADPLTSHHVNATGTLQVLEAARRHDRPPVILASSSSVYGANNALPKSEDLTPMPMSPYAVSKLAAESYAIAYAQCFGLDVLAFRFFNVYGPFQAADHAYAAVVPTFVSAALNGEPLPIHGDGGQTRDFTYVGTVTALIQSAIERRVTNPRPVNLAFGTRASVLDLVQELSALLEVSLATVTLPPRPGDVRDSQADTRQLRRLFPQASPTPLSEGLAATVSWHQTGTAEPPVEA